MFCREVKIDTHLAEGIAAIAGPTIFTPISDYNEW